MSIAKRWVKLVFGRNKHQRASGKQYKHTHPKQTNLRFEMLEDRVVPNANETIQVVYKPLNYPVLGQYLYHETLVYTNSQGEQFYTSGDYSNDKGNLNQELGIGGVADNLVAAAVDVEYDVPSVWGVLTTSTNISLTSANQVGITNDANGKAYPSEVVASASDLSGQWAAINNAELEAVAQKPTYSPATQNSNSLATVGLDGAGIAPPTDNGMFSSHWAPAASDFTSSCTKDSLGDSILNINETNNYGTTLDSLQFVTNPSANETNASLTVNGTVTRTESTAVSASGVQTDDLQVLNGSDTVQYTQDVSITNGQITDYIEGIGAVCSEADAVVSLAPNTTATISNEGGDIVSIAIGDTVTVANGNTSPDLLDIPNGTVTVDEFGDATLAHSVKLSPQSLIAVGDTGVFTIGASTDFVNNGSIIVSGSSTFDQGGTLVSFGNITATGNSSFSVGGTGALTLDSGTLNIGANASADNQGSFSETGTSTVTDDGDFITSNSVNVGDNSQFNIGGTGSVTTSAGTFTISGGASGNNQGSFSETGTSTVTDNGDFITSGSITASDQSQLIIGGGFNDTSGSVAINSSATVTGTGTMIVANDGSLSVQGSYTADAGATVSDLGTISVVSSGSVDDQGNFSIEFNGSLSIFGFYTISGGITLTNQGLVVVENSGKLSDPGTIAISQGSTFSVSGTVANNDLNVSSDGGTVNLPGGDTLGLIGPGGVTVNAPNGNDTISIPNGNSISDTFNGSNVDLTAGPNAVLNVNGNGFTLNLNTNDSCYLTGSCTIGSAYGSDIFNLGSNTQASFSSPGLTVNLSPNDTISISNSTENVGSNTTEWITGNYNTIQGGTGLTLNLNGNNDVANVESSSVNYSGGNLQGDDVNGQNDQTNGTDTDNGGYGGGGGGGGGGYGYGYYGYAFASSSDLSGDGIGSIAQRDLEEGNTTAAHGLESARTEAYLTANHVASGVGSSSSFVYAGPRWESNYITYEDELGNNYLSDVNAMVQAWENSSDLVFVPTNSSTADITLEWAKFNTKSTGILGLTEWTNHYGAMQNCTIQLEAPTQYAISNAEVIAVGTHEFGHSIGLGDSADPKSNMFPVVNSNNSSLDHTDVAGVRALYTPEIHSSTGLLAANTKTLVITGSGFSTEASQDIVKFNEGVTGVVTSATPTQLTITNVKGLVAGDLTATVSINGDTSGSAVVVATVTPVVTAAKTNLAANARTLIIAGYGFPDLHADTTVSFSNGSKGVVTAATATHLTITFTDLIAGDLYVVVTSNGVNSGKAVLVAIVV
ncbi:MAG TPA: matrixin family metalloprotease [Gemmata sp.]|nr:matrixin family metalloprotease [Gemmata sp.]